MKLIKELRADPDGVVTKRLMLRGYLRNRRRTIAAYVVCLALAASFALYTRHQDADQKASTRRQCESRQTAVIKANAFYQTLADLERTNKFIDQTLRDARVKAYTGNVYAVPNC